MVSGNLKFGLWQYSSPLVSSSISTPLNSWHYIGYTYDGTSFNAYVNGKNAGSVASFARQTPYIGYGSGLYYGIGHLDVTNLGNGGYGNFKLGAMHVYGRSLSAPEVALNYNTTKSQYQIIQNGLMANLISPTNSGTIWTDLSGNGNNATLVGSPTYTSTNGGGYTTSSSSYISTGYNLPNTFTVSVACSINPSSYWATLWGNETWNSSAGYIAYFSSSGGLNFGSPSGQAAITLTGYNSVHIWDFVVNGISYVLYKDGVSFSSGTITAPSGGSSSNSLYFGARHTNGGTSYTDPCPSTFYSMRVYNRALSASEININFSVLRGYYGL
jgi:hypothetical protein